MYVSTTGNTEYVVHVLADYLREKAPELEVEVEKVEKTKPEDLLRGDVLILASGTWNIGGVEGHLNPVIYSFIHKDAKDIDLQEKPVAIISLGGSQYYYTSRSSERLRNFIMEHNGKVLKQPLTIIDEPYDQDERIKKWGDKLLTWVEDL